MHLTTVSSGCDAVTRSGILHYHKRSILSIDAKSTTERQALLATHNLECHRSISALYPALVPAVSELQNSTRAFPSFCHGHILRSTKKVGKHVAIELGNAAMLERVGTGEIDDGDDSTAGEKAAF